MDGATTQPARRQGWAMLLFVVWLCWTAAGLWWFEWQQPAAQTGSELRSAAFDPAVLEGATLPADAQSKVLVVSLSDPDCVCAQSAANRGAVLARRFASAPVRFLELPPPGQLSAGVEPADRALAASLWARIPADPAALVVAPDGTVAYLGPWIVPEWCSSGAGDLLERAIATAARGHASPAQPMLATGCLCRVAPASRITQGQGTG
jgi:hypothetical protein